MPLDVSFSDLVKSLPGLMAIVGAGFAVRHLALREKRIKQQYERIKGNGKCEGAAEVPAGAELLLTTDETDGNLKQGQVWLKDKNLYVSRVLLWKDTALLGAWYGMPYLRISLDAVEECRVDTGVIVFGLPSVPCEASVIYAYERAAALTGQEKFAAALKQNLTCPIENAGAIVPPGPDGTSEAPCKTS